MKSILAITPFFGRSGSEIALLNLCEGLQEEFDISIYSPQKNPDLLYNLSDKIKFYGPFKKDKNKNFFSKLKHAVRPITDIEKNLGDKKFDFILLNTFLSLKYFDLAHIRSRRIILYVHETEVMLSGLDMNYFKKILNETEMIFCSSNYVKNYLTLLGTKKNIKVLYPAVNFEGFQLPVNNRSIKKDLGFQEEDFLWGMTGALTANKNPGMFIEAAELLIKKHPNVGFIWIGARKNDTYREYLESYINKKGLSNRIVFIEKLEQNYFDYLNILNGYVLTSYSESFSLSALEAASFNIPVVSFPCGGILEAVPEKLRWITKEFSINELTQHMATIMNGDVMRIPREERDTLLSKDKSCAAKNFKEGLSHLS